MDKILKLKPFYSEKVWGYENWSLSTHINGQCTVEGSKKTLLETINKELPIIVKIIQADETLSVQVHPDNNYAKIHDNENGKTECWYILDAKEKASLICGIKEGLDKDSLRKIIDKGNIECYLKRIKVKAGDMIYIPVGTVHAIEGGIKLIEVQQSSDATYRMYDWGRDRETHIDKSLDVIDYEGKNNGGKIENFNKLETPYFTVEKIAVNGYYKDNVDCDFYCYTVIDGSGYITDGEEIINLSSEETIYIPNAMSYEIKGRLNLIKSYV